MEGERGRVRRVIYILYIEREIKRRREIGRVRGTGTGTGRGRG